MLSRQCGLARERGAAMDDRVNIAPLVEARLASRLLDVLIRAR
jgi:hypothetical protein